MMGSALENPLLVVALFLFSVFSEVKSSTWELLIFSGRHITTEVCKRGSLSQIHLPCAVSDTPAQPPLLGICSAQENAEDPKCQEEDLPPLFAQSGMWVSHCLF